MFLGLLQTCKACYFGDLRYNLLTKSLAIVAGILIVFTDNQPLIVVSATYIFVLMAVSLLRRVKRLFSAPTFVDVQQRQSQGDDVAGIGKDHDGR